MVATGSPVPAAAAPESLLCLQAAAGGQAAVPHGTGAGAALGHAELILDDLGALQRAMLGAGGAAGLAVLERLAGRLGGAPARGWQRDDGADPRLADLMEAVALRAEIELARRGMRREEAGRDSATAGDGAGGAAARDGG